MAIARQVIAIPHVVKLEAYSSLTSFLSSDINPSSVAGSARPGRSLRQPRLAFSKVRF